MEELKAPKKIYIQSFNISEEDAKFDKSKMFFDDVWTEEPESGQKNIEYIRTDTVIGWLKDCSTNKDFNGDTYVDEDLFNTMVEDFKNYMKGE